MQAQPAWRRLLALAGVDRAIGWSTAPQFWSALFGPLTLALIATRLTPEQQGFYFTFGSIAATQALFELGLNSVILQFVSHERAFLEWQPDGTLGGSEPHKGRLASLMHSALRWYAVAGLLFAIAMAVGGSIFFATRPSGVVGWEWPWLIVAIVTAATLFLSPALAALEGAGEVTEVARIRAGQVVASDFAGWPVLLLGGGLWAPAASALAATTFAFARVGGKWGHFFADLFRTPHGELSWREEVWPFQWRTALGWASTYFASQALTPLVFYFAGAAAAGRMGMTMLILNAMLNISMAWVWTKRPALAMHVARREFAELDALFFPAFARSFAIMAAGCVAFVCAVFALHAIEHPIRERLLDPTSLLMVTAAILAMQVMWAESAYLRAHKQEAFMGVRMAAAVLMVTGALLAGPRWGVFGISTAMLVVSVVVSLGAGTWVFVTKRREWHS